MNHQGNYSTKNGGREERAWTAALILAIGILIGVAMCCIQALCISAQAEDIDCWVMCRDADYINIREAPRKRAQVGGRALAGMRLTTDGAEKNGFLHVVGVTEAGEGWIHAGYVVYSEPVALGREYMILAEGRVACRKWIGGPRRSWVRDGDIVTVYYWTPEWCLTNRGYIRSEYVLTGR